MKDVEIEAVALAMEGHIFASRELPLGAVMHAKYLDQARVAIAALDAARGNGWMPIATAPRDRTTIDLWFSGDPWNCRFADAQWRSDWGWGMIHRGLIYTDDPKVITHWRPLPAPPEDKP